MSKKSLLEQAKEMFFNKYPDARKSYEEIQKLQKYVDENPEKVFPKEFLRKTEENEQYNCPNKCPKCGADGEDEDKIRWDCSIDEEFIKIFPAHCFNCDIDFREIHNIIYSHTEIEE